jgi:hypothetical protein
LKINMLKATVFALRSSLDIRSNNLRCCYSLNVAADTRPTGGGAERSWDLTL